MKKGKSQIERIASEVRAKLEQDGRLSVVLSNVDARAVLWALEELSGTMPTWDVGDGDSLTVVASMTASGSVASTTVVQS